MKALKWPAFWLILAVAAGIILWQVAIRWTPPVSQYASQGVTISAAQGSVHWPTLRANGADFAYIHATNGDTGRDPKFVENWDRARASGISYGAVHIWQLCRLAADQATNFIATVPADANALPPAVSLQFEDNCAARPDTALLITELATFLEMIEAHTERPALLHVSRDFDREYEITDRVERSFWLSRRLFPPDYGAVPWVMWEASDVRRVEGVENLTRWNVVRPAQPR